jgi:hypothetical protein
MSYEEVLERTEQETFKTVEGGSKNEKKAIKKFKELFSPYTEENIKAKVRSVYADNAYFNDTLKEINGIDKIADYLIKSAQALESGTVEFTDLAVSHDNYYFRWIMDLRFKSLKKDQTCRSYGISHIRFDEQGKVIMHHDYWDSVNGLFKHFPLLGNVLTFLKNRF